MTTAPASVPPHLLECLDAVHRLERERASTGVAHVAKRLGVPREVAMERVLALQGLRLVEQDDAGAVHVADGGRRLAVGLVRKHRLLERFLTDQLRLAWDRVHVEACRLTPVISDDVANALATLLGHPTTCPHGNPIPTPDGTLASEGGTPLHQFASGRRGEIVRIEREDPEVLGYLAALGLLPDAAVEVEEVGPFGGPVLVRVGDSRYAIGRKVAARIFVRDAR